MRKDTAKIIGLFLGWRLFLVIITIVAVNFVPLGYKDRFLGGGAINYSIAPGLFSWANFDGEHYLSISIYGYKSLEQAFFPLYPTLISFFAKLLPLNFHPAILNTTVIGIAISNLSFIAALVLLFKLLTIDYSKKVASLCLILLVIFPTSFYFGAVYSESLFLFLVLASFYSVRKKNWFLASFFASVASAIRVFGILLLPVLIIEAWQQKASWRQYLWIFLSPIGFLLYMYYQNSTVGDPFAFYNLQLLVGQQHQTGIVLFPQVIFRYIKVLMTFEKFNPLYQTVLLEFITGILFLVLPIYGYFKKIRLSYLFFAITGFLLPTFQGSFSSLPRYVIVLFPSFLALAIWLNNRSRLTRAIIILIFILGLSLESILFLRGYWVA